MIQMKMYEMAKENIAGGSFDPVSKYRVQVIIPGRQDVPCAKESGLP